MTEPRQARRFRISGYVQGVGYRFFVRECAQRHGFTGYVKNLSDGDVEVYAVGTAQQLDVLLSELRSGPRHASVERVTTDEAERLSAYEHDFSIEF